MSRPRTRTYRKKLGAEPCWSGHVGTMIVAGTLVACASNALVTRRDKRGEAARSAATTTATTTTDADGATIGRLSAVSSGEQVLQADSVALRGASLSLPAGAIGIDLDVTISEGAALATADIATSLGIGNDDVASAGPTVIFSPSETVESSVPFTLSIPFDSAALRLVGEAYAVLYKTIGIAADGSKAYEIGVIPSTEIELAGATLRFATTRFGAFQAVRTKVEITKKVSVASYEPIAVKKSTSNSFLGKWGRSCHADGNNGPQTPPAGDSGSALLEDGGSGDYTQRYRTETLSMSEDSFSFVGATFTTADCSGSFQSQEGFAGTYEIVGDAPTVSGASRIDLSFSSAIRTFATTEAIKHANIEMICGISDWKLGEPRNVIDHDCGDKGGPTKERLMRQLIKVEGENLRFGNDHDVADGEYPTQMEEIEKTMQRLP